MRSGKLQVTCVDSSGKMPRDLGWFARIAWIYPVDVPPGIKLEAQSDPLRAGTHRGLLRDQRKPGMLRLCCLRESHRDAANNHQQHRHLPLKTSYPTAHRATMQILGEKQRQARSQMHL